MIKRSLAAVVLVFLVAGLAEAGHGQLNIKIKINLDEKTFKNFRNVISTVRHPEDGFHRNMADLNVQLKDRHNWKMLIEKQVVMAIRKQAR